VSTRPNNFEAVIILRDTKSNIVYYNPGGFKVLYSENEQKNVITKHMTTLEWQFWKKLTTIDPFTGVVISIDRNVLNDERTVDYSY
jgi:ribosomal protein L19